MNKYRHPKSSLFLMEIMLNILFFAVLVTICLQLFFKAHTLSNDTTILHQAVTVCTSLAEVYQSSENGEESILKIYPEAIELNNMILVYYTDGFLPCSEANSSYRAILEKNDNQHMTTISFYATEASEVIYSVVVSSYSPMSLDSLLGGDAE